jgi:cytochrome aa3-600 menaquinol oxidase subunit 1
VPLQIGARDVAFPRLNAISFWLTAFAALLFNLSFVVGGSPTAGWSAYPPLSELSFNPTVGQNYYLMALLISGIGTVATGVNFLVTILRMRAPGMTLMRMPLFVWSAGVTSVLILFAFPALTVALALTLLDRIAGSTFFTLGHGGMPMMFVNLFWIWGHPEVYILVLPAFGVFSEIVPVFSRKRLFGYTAMVASILAITALSFGVWVHHFFTMGAGAAVNVFFGVSTMLIAIPTGVKVFNWLFTMWRGRVRLQVPMLYALAFIPTFVVGGATGVMLGTVPADYQLHNTYFLVAHFHNVLIGGVLFGMLAAMHYWWPKMFGHTLDERSGRWAFWLFFSGFWVTFTPQYLLGLQGMPRRIYTYPAGLGWTALNQISTLGAFVMGAAFIVLVYSIAYSALHARRDVTGDPWDGRTLEWSLPSPAPEYNFAAIPQVGDRDAWWEAKQRGTPAAPERGAIGPIHVPKRTSQPFFLGLSFFVFGFGIVFSWWDIALVGLAGVLAMMLVAMLDYHDYEELGDEEVRRSEASLGRMPA